MEDYDFFVRDSAFFCERLQALTELRGRAVVNGWIEQVQHGQTEAVVHNLLALHYDPMYAASIQRNFVQYGQARVCELPSRSAADMAAAATALIGTVQAAG